MLDPLNRAFRVSYLILWVVVFARQACLPVPANLFLLTAGAFARDGELNMLLVLVIGVLGCLAGDLVWFEAGRHWGRQIIRVLCLFSSDPHYCAQRAHSIYARWGLRSLIVAKFIPGLDSVTPPLAGIEGSSRLAFLAYDSLGSLLWSGLYAVLGYLFASRLAVIAVSMARFGDVLLLVVGIPLAFYIIRHIWVMMQMLCHLRLRRITPALLHERITSADQVAILDLLSFEEGDEGLAGIPGAVRIDPTSPPQPNSSGRTGERGNCLVLFFFRGVNQCTRGGCLTKKGHLERLGSRGRTRRMEDGRFPCNCAFEYLK